MYRNNKQKKKATFQFRDIDFTPGSRDQPRCSSPPGHRGDSGYPSARWWVDDPGPSIFFVADLAWKWKLWEFGNNAMRMGNGSAAGEEYQYSRRNNGPYLSVSVHVVPLCLTFQNSYYTFIYVLSSLLPIRISNLPKFISSDELLVRCVPFKLATTFLIAHFGHLWL